MSTPARIEIVDEGATRFVRFLDRRLFDDRTVREVAEQLAAVLPPDDSPIRLILDFSSVDSLASSLLGKLVVLQRRVEKAGGTLRLCEMSTNVRAVFRTSNLDRLFAIDRDRREAAEAAEAD